MLNELDPCNHFRIFLFQLSMFFLFFFLATLCLIVFNMPAVELCVTNVDMYG